MIEKRKFIKIKSSQVLNKFFQLKKSNQILKVWLKGKNAIEIPLGRVLQEDDVLLVFAKDDFPYNLTKENPEKCYLCFTLGELQYFSMMSPVQGECDGNVDNYDLYFKLDSEVYRFERRDNERLLTYPTYSTYAYFSTEDAVGDYENVISFIRDDQVKLFSDIKKNYQPSILEEDEVKGFRLQDISTTGFSFLVSEKEEGYFKHYQTNSKKFNNVIISHEDQIFKVTNAKVKYLIDYINPIAKNLRFQKVGVSFEKNDFLTEFLDAIFEKSNSFDNLKTEFENEN